MSIYQKKIITSGCRLWPSTGVFNYWYPTQVPARLLPQQWCWKTPNSVFQICLGCHRTAPGEKIRVCQIWLLVWPFIWLLIWILLSTCIWVLQTQGLTFPLNYGHLTAAPNTVHGEVNRYMDIWQSPHRKQQLRTYIFFHQVVHWTLGALLYRTRFFPLRWDSHKTFYLRIVNEMFSYIRCIWTHSSHSNSSREQHLY